MENTKYCFFKPTCPCFNPIRCADFDGEEVPVGLECVVRLIDECSSMGKTIADQSSKIYSLSNKNEELGKIVEKCSDIIDDNIRLRTAIEILDENIKRSQD